MQCKLCTPLTDKIRKVVFDGFPKSEKAVYITMWEKFSEWILNFCMWSENKAWAQLRLVWQIYLHICILAPNTQKEV